MSELIIERIETACVFPRWGLLRLTIRGGPHGYGEFTVEGQVKAAEAMAQQLAEYFIGRDARDVNRLVRGCYDQHFYHSGVHFLSALAGIEIALWDAVSRYHEVPLHRLMGGRVRNKVKVYRWAGGNNNTPAQAAEEAAAVVAQGTRALKLIASPPLAAIDTYGGVATAVERARAVREAVGPDVSLGFDFHGRCNVPMARRLIHELECVDPMFYEEPVRPEYNRWLPEMAASTHVPIATGERMGTVAEFSDLVSACGVHILQPDLVHVGGISNTLEIAALAKANGIAIAPHCPLSPIAFMASLQVIAQSPAGWILEWAKGIHYHGRAVEGEVDPWLRYVSSSDWDKFSLDASGHMTIPDSPGLGISINWEEVTRAAETGSGWRDEYMTLPDGTVANW